jgi:hypothetical protein
MLLRGGSTAVSDRGKEREGKDQGKPESEGKGRTGDRFSQFAVGRSTA